MMKTSPWVVVACLVGAVLLILALLMREHIVPLPSFLAAGAPATATPTVQCPGAPAVPDPHVKEFCAWNRDGHSFEHRVQV